MSRIRRTAALVALLAGVVTIPVAGASASGWLPPETMATAASDLGFDADGNALAVGTGVGDDPVVTATERAFGGTWNAPVPLSGAADLGASAPKVSVAPNGDAVAVWSAHDANADQRVVRVARRLAGQPWSVPVTVSSAPVTPFPDDHAVVIADGRATVAWIELDPDGGTTNVVRSVTTAVAGDWSGVAGTASTLSSATTGHAQDPQLAADPQGNVTAVWLVPAVTGTLVQARRSSPDGTWDPIVVLLGSGIGVEAPQVVVDDQGRATAAWSATVDGVGGIRAVRETSPGLLVRRDLGPGHSARLVVDPEGNATVVWLSAASSEASVLSRRSAAGTGEWDASEPIATSDGDGGVGMPWVGADAEGNVTAIWARGSLADPIAETARRSAGAVAWRRTADLPVGPLSLSLPAVGVDPLGHATVTWTPAPDPSRPAGSSSILDPIPPILRELTVPATGVVGQPVTLSVAPFDVSPVDVTWSFGDGATATGPTAVHTFTTTGERAVTITGVDRAGNETRVTRQIAITSAPGSGPDPDPDPDPTPGPDPEPAPPIPGPEPAPDPMPTPIPPTVVAPVLSGLKQNVSRWNTRRVRGSILPVGTEFSFRLDRAARVRLSFERVLDGRRAGKKCAKPTKKNRKKAKCKRFQKRGSISVAGKAGGNFIRFRGRVGGKTLPAGRYRMQATAAADGRTSKAATITFTIAR